MLNRCHRPTTSQEHRVADTSSPTCQGRPLRLGVRSLPKARLARDRTAPGAVCRAGQRGNKFSSAFHHMLIPGLQGTESR